MGCKSLTMCAVLKRINAGDLPGYGPTGNMVFEDGTRAAPGVMGILLRCGVIDRPTSNSIGAKFVLTHQNKEACDAK